MNPLKLALRGVVYAVLMSMVAETCAKALKPAAATGSQTENIFIW